MRCEEQQVDLPVSSRQQVVAIRWLRRRAVCGFVVQGVEACLMRQRAEAKKERRESWLEGKGREEVGEAVVKGWKHKFKAKGRRDWIWG